MTSPTCKTDECSLDCRRSSDRTRAQLDAGERLDQIVAGIQAGDEIGHIAAGGEQQRRRAGVLRSHVAHTIQTVFPRKHNAEQGQIIALDGDEFFRGQAIVQDVDGIVFAQQRFFYKRSDVLFIFNNE